MSAQDCEGRPLRCSGLAKYYRLVLLVLLELLVLLATPHNPVNLSICQSVNKKGRGYFFQGGADFPYNKKIYKYIFFIIQRFQRENTPLLTFDRLTDDRFLMFVIMCNKIQEFFVLKCIVSICYTFVKITENHFSSFLLAGLERNPYLCIRKSTDIPIEGQGEYCFDDFPSAKVQG